jgi:hypothetical protein
LETVSDKIKHISDTLPLIKDFQHKINNNLDKMKEDENDLVDFQQQFIANLNKIKPSKTPFELVKDKLQKYSELETILNNTEYHVPGQSFTGPGTHVATKLLNNILPKNKTDYYTMLHDIEYSGPSSLKSDLNTILRSDFDIPGVLTKLGLGAVLPLSIIGKNPFTVLDKDKYDTMKKYISMEPNYIAAKDKYQSINMIDILNVIGGKNNTP